MKNKMLHIKIIFKNIINMRRAFQVYKQIFIFKNIKKKISKIYYKKLIIYNYFSNMIW